MFADMTVGAFMEDLASASPAPGGGAAAAMGGALGAGLISMVCNLTVGKKGYEQYWQDNAEVQARAEELQIRLIGLAREDAEAFNALMETFKLPKNTGEEKQERMQIMQAAYCRAALVPFGIAGACLEVVRKARQIAGRSNANVASDIEVAVFMAEAGMESGLVNVLVNLPYITDAGFVDEKNRQITEMRKEMAEYAEAVRTELLVVKG